MKLQLAHKINDTRSAPHQPRFIPVIVPDTSRLQPLTEDDKPEVLGFLAQRPVHTVVMTSMIHDNGIESDQSRGRFYSYRNTAGKLEGVALIGHTTLVEARSEESLIALALAARNSETPIHIMMSDGDSIQSFWDYYSGGTKEPRLVCSERLFEIKFPVPVRETVAGLRLATEAELMPVAESHAEIALMESGVNPMERDREGFLKRVMRRIKKDRVWVVVDEQGKLVFKADIVAETPDVKYLEGIYVHPEYRGRGIGANCLSQLSRTLLETVKYVCLLSNEDFQNAHRSYLKAGFKSQDCCVTIFA
jgi:uncharacterized protein